MPPPDRRLALGASVMLLGLAPLVIERVAPGGASSWILAVATIFQAGAIAWLIGDRWAAHTRIIAAFAVAAMVAVGAILSGRAVALAVNGGFDTAAYLTLLVWFASSLRSGREPVITGFARRLRRSMPDKVSRYTRRVTFAWCLFFTAHLVVSAVLLATRPEAVWTGFLSLLNLPLLAAMMLGEFACRLVLFRHEPRTGLAATLAALRQPGFLRGNRP